MSGVVPRAHQKVSVIVRVRRAKHHTASSDTPMQELFIARLCASSDVSSGQKKIDCTIGGKQQSKNSIHREVKAQRDKTLCDRIVIHAHNDALTSQMRLSIPRWSAGAKRSDVTGSTTECFHVIMIQETETHDHGIWRNEQQQSHPPGCEPAHLVKKNFSSPEVWRAMKRSMARQNESPSV